MKHSWMDWRMKGLNSAATILVAAGTAMAGPPDGSPDYPWQGVQDGGFGDSNCKGPYPSKWYKGITGDTEKDCKACRDISIHIETGESPKCAALELHPLYLLFDSIKDRYFCSETPCEYEDCEEKRCALCVNSPQYVGVTQGYIEVAQGDSFALYLDLKAEDVTDFGECTPPSLDCDPIVFHIIVGEYGRGIGGFIQNHTYEVRRSMLSSSWQRFVVTGPRDNSCSLFWVTLQLALGRPATAAIHPAHYYNSVVSVDNVHLIGWDSDCCLDKEDCDGCPATEPISKQCVDFNCFGSPGTNCAAPLSGGPKSNMTCEDPIEIPCAAPDCNATPNKSCPFCQWDLNEDGVVDGGDIGTLLGYWGPCSESPFCECCPGDFVEDFGVVDGADLGALLFHVGETCLPVEVRDKK